MNSPGSLAIRSLTTLLKETLFRAGEHSGYLLNPKDPGLVDTLRGVSAEIASTPPAPGRKPVVAHSNHILYGIELANRALSGEQGVHENADWDVAWRLESVDDAQWQELVDRIERESLLLIDLVNQAREWDEIMFTGVSAIAPHAAYHLGAIRQMLLDIEK
jgi:hypothetical protein